MNDYAEYRSPAGVLYRGVLSNPEAPTCLYGPYVQKSLEGLEFVRYLSKEECDALPESEYPQPLSMSQKAFIAFNMSVYTVKIKEHGKQNT